MSELRKEKTEDIQKVALALWEPGETISIFLNPQYQPLTPANTSIATKPFAFPRAIIKERKFDYDELLQLGKDEQWVVNKISKTYNVTIDDVLLATLDQNENLQIFLYK
ncbi:YetF domain-containing protein [Risungbinella massiliensis]|uniref:YetF domain-containing protein n=1 Tax=Risungbinella massiliensis TaxID=1329796 RepID=UPI0006997120|nr:YetF domain-containing protein [Risungbinella massiliensis]